MFSQTMPFYILVYSTGRFQQKFPVIKHSRTLTKSDHINVYLTAAVIVNTAESASGFREEDKVLQQGKQLVLF